MAEEIRISIAEDGLMDYLPDYYDGNLSMEELQKIVGEEFLSICRKTDGALADCLPATAVSGIDRWRKIYGLSEDPGSSMQLLRDSLAARMIGWGTITEEKLREIAESFTNTEVEVETDAAAYTVNIRFVGSIGEPENIDIVKAAIEDAVPAHLGVTYTFIYHAHKDYAGNTHAELSQHTHRALRIR